MPGLQTIRTYQRSWLPRDVAAGIVLTTLLVPAGMGYAEASGLPAIYGLYATVVLLVVYAIFFRDGEPPSSGKLGGGHGLRPPR